MDKMAIFVEGHTEVLFVDKLVTEIANDNAVQIQWREIRGGTNTRRTKAQIKAVGPSAGQKHFVLIFDCGGDSAVKMRMIQEYKELAKAGYSKIVCIRDVYDKFTHAEIPQLESELPKYVPTKPIVVDFILSIMEVEAWFLAECTHFERIDPAITAAAIVTALGFNPENDDMQLRATPANDLASCYALGMKTYLKGDAQTTVDAIDYSEIYLSVAEKFPYLRRLCTAIETFLTT